MRFTLLRRAALAAAVGALALPASAFGIANIVESDDALRDYDARVGKVAPTKAQKAAAKRLHAKVTWNRFGTPETVSKRGKFLAKGIRGKTAPEAARRWIHRNRALFRLELDLGLELAGDSPLPFSRGSRGQLPPGRAGSRDHRRRPDHGRHHQDGEEQGLERRLRLVVARRRTPRSTDGRSCLAVQAWLRAADSVGLDGYSIGARHVGQERARLDAAGSRRTRSGAGRQGGRVPDHPLRPCAGVRVDRREGARTRSASRSSSTRAPARCCREPTSCTTSPRSKGSAKAARGVHVQRRRSPRPRARATTHGPFAIAAGNRALDGFAAAADAARTTSCSSS